MKQKTYQAIKKLLFLLVLVFVFYAVFTGNLLMAILSILIEMLILSLLKRQTKEVIEDERNKVVGEKAARATLNITVIVLAIISFLLIFLTKEGQFYLQSLGIVLSYTTIFILFVYMISYWFFNREFGGNEK